MLDKDLREPGLLESALARPLNLTAHAKPDHADLAACYGVGIAKNHPFLDGNKRTAFVAMLSCVLRSPRAVEVNIAIMRTFVQLRRLMDSNCDLARKIEAMEKKYDEQFAVAFDAIRQLIAEDQARKAQAWHPRRSFWMICRKGDRSTIERRGSVALALVDRSLDLRRRQRHIYFNQKPSASSSLKYVIAACLAGTRKKWNGIGSKRPFVNGPAATGSPHAYCARTWPRKAESATPRPL